MLSTCYEQVDDFYNAQKYFEKIYNCKDKKALKRYNYLSGTRKLVQIRPSQRCLNLPNFRYVTNHVLKNYFVSSKAGETCCICGKENVAFYTGYAYKEKIFVLFSGDNERFCSECSPNEKAVKEKISLLIPDYSKNLNKFQKKSGKYY